MHPENNKKTGRDDMHQVISCMHILKSNRGCFKVDIENNGEAKGTINGHGGTFHEYGMKIPNKLDNFKEFVEQIKEGETLIKNRFK